MLTFIFSRYFWRINSHINAFYYLYSTLILSVLTLQKSLTLESLAAATPQQSAETVDWIEFQNLW